jgi:phytoene/squalene synthetase
VLGGRYRDYDGLLAYCELSGAALGVLTAHGLIRNPEPATVQRVAAIYASARLLVICASVREDAERAQVYVPTIELTLRGLRTCDVITDLPRVVRPLSDAVEALSARAFYALREAEPVLRELSMSARLAVGGVVAEAVTLHRELHRAGVNVLRQPLPVPRWSLWRTLVRVLRQPMGD